jgi:hypothetical protein
MVQATSRRLLDLLDHWVDVNRLPSARQLWRRLELARELGYEQPWAHAVLRTLQLEAYGKSRRPDSRWIARRLGIDVAEVERGLLTLQAAGQSARQRGRWVPQRVERLDMGRDFERSRRLKRHWTEVALHRLAAGNSGSFGYSLFEVSRSDLQKLRDLQLEHVRAIQHIVSQSRGTECIGLYCAQLLALGEGQGPKAP